jgi:hypothetical protein
MFRKILISSILAISSAISFCAQAQAETQDVTFSGNIPFKCTFNNVKSGTLKVGYKPNFIEGSKSFGTMGSVDISCNAVATVSVSDPVDTGSASTLTGPYSGSIIANGTSTAGSTTAISNSWQGVSNSTLKINPGTTTIQVSVIKDAGDGNSLKAGDYKIKTTVTAVP